MYSHFSRIILAHNQDGFWRPDLIARFKPDIVILEVLESGLRVAAGDGPPPSAAALARIDHVLGAATPLTQAPTMPILAATPDKIAEALAAAPPTPNCNFEAATLTPGVKGEATLAVSGWVSELRPSITSPTGYLRLKGPAGDFAAPIPVNGKRPDVASFFKTATGAESGFLGTYLIKRLPAGAYTASVYREAPGGWIACVGTQTLSAPP
jgi:hypothetical protein